MTLMWSFSLAHDATASMTSSVVERETIASIRDSTRVDQTVQIDPAGGHDQHAERLLRT